MFFKRWFACISVLITAFAAVAQVPIGNWREHLPYGQAVQVAAAGSRVFCATPYSLFTVDLAENTINRMSRVNGLSETGISALAFDSVAGKLIVAYTNSNIDVLYNNRIVNIDAIKRKDIAADKSIYRIWCYRRKAYLCTGLGVVVVDEDKDEVKDTYVTGQAGGYEKVNGFAANDSFFYAAGEEGLKRAGVNALNLSDYRNWQLLNGSGGLPRGACRQVMNVQGRIVAQQADSLFVLNGNAWSLLYASDWNIVNTDASGGRMVVCQQKPGGQGRVVVLNADGSVQAAILQNNLVTSPAQGVLLNGEVWIADRVSGLLRSTANALQQYRPNGPFSVATGEMVFNGNSLWVASGSVTSDWNNTFTKNGLYRFAGNEWASFTPASLPALDSLYDLVTIAVSPADNSVWAGSFGGGLLQLKADNTPVVYKQGTGPGPSLSDPQSYRVAGLAFDADNNLWMSGYGAAANLTVRKADGSWRSFTAPFSLSDNALAQVLVDDQNQKWIVSPNGNGLCCFNHGGTIDNTGDDRWMLYRAGKGNGNLPDNSVLSVAKDRNGYIWVGTANGIGIIQCPAQVFTVQGCEAVLPVVQQDNFAGYLFSGEAVQAIAVDGADRKWIGTKNGAWLVTPDGDKTLYHFREDNSPLLSDDVRKIAIDPASGEVFLATAKGICSFRGTATEGGLANETVLAFPNPVPPGFNGTIAIRGLVNNAIVKITEPDGRLVYQTRANGGQATWNGRDYRGNKIASGVYLVLVSDDTRKEKMAARIVFIR